MARATGMVLGWVLAWLGMVPAWGEDAARFELLSRLARDPSPAVRVEALRGLARIPTAESAATALGVLELPMDATLDYALWLTLNDLAEPWIRAVESGVWRAEGKEAQLAFALGALRPEQVGRVLGTVLGERALPRDGSGPWIEAIGAAGAPEHLERLLRQAREGGFDEAATVRALRALGEAARLRDRKPRGDGSAVGTFLRSRSGAVRMEAVRLAGQWKAIGDALPVLLNEVAGRAGAPAEERAAAFDALRAIGGEAVVRALRDWSVSSADPSVRRLAATTLVAVDGVGGMPAVLAVAGTIGDEGEAVEFWRAVLATRGAGMALREALEGQRLPAVVARAGLRVAREGGRDDLELVAELARAGGLATDTEAMTGELLKEWAARAEAEGDPHRGEWVYRRPELACVTCHAIGGVGGKVGPDMTSIGASAPLDYLVESLLLPHAKIKEGYHSVIVETREGEEVTGTVARETPEELFLRNAAGQEVSIAKGSIVRREMGRLSLMPGGLLEPLSEQERLDLYAFLGRLGKPGDFDASRGGVARRWRVANVVHTDLQNNQGDWYWRRPLDDRRWATVDSLVRGDVPERALEEATRAQAWTSKVAVVLATEIELAVEGGVSFRWVPEEAELWVGGKRLDAGPVAEARIAAGRHRVIVKLDPRRVPERVRLEAEGAVFVVE
ncbi:MAG: c-type cytochrome [Verrucomicrobiae bacterium]|nr:c-type cytochrome [Verrucomicrobiae bacterium]